MTGAITRSRDQHDTKCHPNCKKKTAPRLFTWSARGHSSDFCYLSPHHYLYTEHKRKPSSFDVNNLKAMPITNLAQYTDQSQIQRPPRPFMRKARTCSSTVLQPNSVLSEPDFAIRNVSSQRRSSSISCTIDRRCLTAHATNSHVSHRSFRAPIDNTEIGQSADLAAKVEAGWELHAAFFFKHLQ